MPRRPKLFDDSVRLADLCSDGHDVEAGTPGALPIGGSFRFGACAARNVHRFPATRVLVDAEQARLAAIRPAWMTDPALLPKRPPGR